MPTNISDFIAQAQKSGFSRPNFFEVVVGFPQKLGGAGSNGRLVTFFCKNASLPAYNILSSRITEEFMPYEAPYGAMLEDVQLEFYVDESYIVRDLFAKWANLVYDQKTAKLGYQDDYKGNIIISQLNRNLVPTYFVNLTTAFPRNISPITLDRSQNDAVTTMTVTFSYKYLETEGTAPSLNPLTQELGQGMFSGQIGSTISSLIGGQSAVTKDVFSGLNDLGKTYVSLSRAMNILSPADQSSVRAGDFTGILADTRTNINPWSNLQIQNYRATRVS
jgi:hypothetical protein